MAEEDPVTFDVPTTGSASGVAASSGLELSTVGLGHAPRVSRCAHAEPSLERRYVLVQNVRTKAIEHELPLSPGLNETRASQLLEMVRHRGLRDGKLLAQPLAAHLATICDFLENLEAPGIGERLGDAFEAFGINRH
jgi:hypothetical protein